MLLEYFPHILQYEVKFEFITVSLLVGAMGNGAYLLGNNFSYQNHMHTPKPLRTQDTLSSLCAFLTFFVLFYRCVRVVVVVVSQFRLNF